MTAFRQVTLCLRGRGQGGRDPVVKRMRSLREAAEEWAGSGSPWVAGTGTIRTTFRNIALYFAIEKAQRGWNDNGRGGNRKYKVPEVESAHFFAPSPPLF